jgi:MoaA/NifB/PqqE/SkfB family radical SAM enzyme
LKGGIECIRSIKPDYKITGRTVIHKLNYRAWPRIIETAKLLGLNKISFLPADISSQAFNREIPWNADRQQDILIPADELPQLEEIIEKLVGNFSGDFSNGFIAESPGKIRKIYAYYSALHGLNSFPYKKCNAPWVSTVIEPDGSVLPCFFHPPVGNIRTDSLEHILNSAAAKDFRKTLDMDTNPTCEKCVCYLNLPPTINPAAN